MPMPAERYLKVVEGAEAGDDQVWFTISALADGGRSDPRPIGITGILDIDHRHGTAEFAIHIGETDERGRGSVTSAPATRHGVRVRHSALSPTENARDSRCRSSAGTRFGIRIR